MRRLPLILLAVCACAAPPPAMEAESIVVAANESEPAATDAETLLEQIEQRAGEIETIEAKIIFDRILGLQGDEQRRFGTVAYHAGPPARFHIHFDRMIDNGAKRRDDQHWIFDGHWLAQRNNEDKTLIRYELSRPEEEGKNPFEINDGPFLLPLDMKKNSVLRRFDARVIDPSTEGPIQLRLIPKPDVDIDLSQMDLWYDRQTLLPTRFHSIDADSEDQTLLVLSKMILNEKLEGVTFDTLAPQEKGWTTSEHRLEQEQTGP